MMRTCTRGAAAALIGALLLWPDASRAQYGSARIAVDLARHVGPLEHVWSWFGHDEPNYTYMEGGQRLLSELAGLSPVPVYVRTHNLLTSGDGAPALKWGSTNAYTEDASGRPVYDWTIVDRIFDTYVRFGVRPLVEIGFMPEALSIRPEPYRHAWAPDRPYQEIFTGWSHPPRDYDRWADLVHAWVRHAMDRYGREAVERWYWQVWNEPDIGYWQGTMEEYFKLYDYSVEAIRRALPTAIVGGPHTTGPAGENAASFLRAFLEHCLRGTNHRTGQTGSPLDFIAFHAKGSPRFVDGHVQMDLGRHLRDISAGFEIVASFPELRHLPVIIGESDPEGCAACSVADNPHNAYRNGSLYASYTAAAFPRKIALADHFGINLRGVVTWAFVFEDQPWFAGFRSLATNGINKPVLNVFRMFGMMRGSRAAVEVEGGYGAFEVRDRSVRGPADVAAFASVDEHEAAVLVWNYHDDHVPGPATTATLAVRGLPEGRLLLQHFRVDDAHSNAYEVWRSMGEPQAPTAEQYEVLERAGQLHLYDMPDWVAAPGGALSLDVALPPQSVSLLRFSW